MVSKTTKSRGFSVNVLSATLVFGVALVILFVGTFAAVFPWWMTLALVFIPMAIFFAFAAPHLGFFIILLLIFNAIPHRLIPKLPVGGGGLEIYDVLIFLLLISLVIKSVIAGISLREKLGKLLVPLLYVFACVLISVFCTRILFPNPFILAEARQHIAWLLLPVAAIAIDTPAKYRGFINVLLVVGVTVAAIMIFQSLTNINVIGGRVEELDRFNSDVTRSTAGGAIYLIIFGLYFFLSASLGGRLSWWIGIPLLIVLMGGLLVTFGRGVWAGTAIGLVVATYLHRGATAAILIPIAASLIAATAIGVVSLGNPRIGEAIADRALGLSKEFESGNSYLYRKSENTEALRVISNRPLMGVGLGGDYKTVATTNNTFEGETRYIHNAYLLLPLKMGLHASLIPIFFIFATASLARRAIAVSSIDSRHVPTSAIGAFIVPVITSITQPEWGVLPGISAICTLMLVLLLHPRFCAPTPMSIN
jgi:hypothetical protein